MPRVVHITTVPDSLRFLRGQAAFMRARGFEISVISSHGPLLDSFRETEGVEAHVVEMARRITPLRDMTSLGHLLEMLRRLRPDIVHAHTPKGGLFGMIAAAAAQIPARVYHMRGLPLLTATGSQRVLLTQTERISCGLAKRVVCVSNSLRREAIEHRLCSAERLTVFGGGSGNGVDATGRFDPSRLAPGTRERVRSELGIPMEATVIGFVGRLVVDKGIRELTDAWETLHAAMPSTYLVLVGEFEDRDAVPAEYRSRLQRSDRVRLLGLRHDVERLYAAFDMVVLPTYREGLPNVPLEAAAMGLPVVATAVTGCLDAVEHGRTGLLIPPRDPVALANAICHYLLDSELRQRHGAAGRERVLRDFVPERIWNDTACLYEELLRSIRSSSRASRTSP